MYIAHICSVGTGGLGGEFVIQYHIPCGTMKNYNMRSPASSSACCGSRPALLGDRRRLLYLKPPIDPASSSWNGDGPHRFSVPKFQATHKVCDKYILLHMDACVGVCSSSSISFSVSPQKLGWAPSSFIQHSSTAAACVPLRDTYLYHYHHIHHI